MNETSQTGAGRIYYRDPVTATPPETAYPPRPSALVEIYPNTVRLCIGCQTFYASRTPEGVHLFSNSGGGTEVSSDNWAAIVTALQRV